MQSGAFKAQEPYQFHSEPNIGTGSILLPAKKTVAQVRVGKDRSTLSFLIEPRLLGHIWVLARKWPILRGKMMFFLRDSVEICRLFSKTPCLRKIKFWKLSRMFIGLHFEKYTEPFRKLNYRRFPIFFNGNSLITYSFSGASTRMYELIIGTYRTACL